jgi:hypothetical protein
VSLQLGKRPVRMNFDSGIIYSHNTYVMYSAAAGYQNGGVRMEIHPDARERVRKGVKILAGKIDLLRSLSIPRAKE